MIKTDAINLCLRYIGESSIPAGITLDELDVQHEAVIISTILDEVATKTQGQGWWFNTEDWIFLPDSTTSKISVPTNILSFRTSNDYILKGSSLYNRDNKSYIFTDSVEATVVWDIKFEELPTSFAYYVTYTAAKEAQMLYNGDSYVDKSLDRSIQESYVRVQREHLRYKGHNLISGSRVISRTTNPTGVV